MTFVVISLVVLVFLLGFAFYQSRKETRERQVYMLKPQIIDGIFLPAPSDERWQCQNPLINGELVLENIRIQQKHGYTVAIEDKSVAATVRGKLWWYCYYTLEHQQSRWRQINHERQLAEVAEASEKNVGLIE